MTSYVYDIGEKELAASRFIADVRGEILDALSTERQYRKVTQQSLAERLGIHRSVVNRQLLGYENMTLRSVAELLWAIGWEPHFAAINPRADGGNQPAFIRSETAAPISKRAYTETRQAGVFEPA